MVTLENWIFKSNFYLVSLEFSGSCDWKIELREVGRHPKGQLVESWPSLHSRYNFPIDRCAKGTRPVCYLECEGKGQSKIFLWLMILHLKEELKSYAKHCGNFLFGTEEQALGLAVRSDIPVPWPSATGCWSGMQREIVAFPWVSTL